jgi:tetratricopeptide (TPR) repeat protein
MRFLKLGATALAGAFLLTGAMAPAMAQQPVAQISKAMGPVYNEVNVAITAKDWATAKAKLNALYPLAKTPQEKLAVEQLRVNVAANTQDWTAMIAAVKAIEALNLLPAADMKTYRGVLAESYRNLNDTPNYLAAHKAYIDQYDATHDVLASFANEAAKANENALALTYISKAIAAAKTAGAKPPESYYRLKARATQGTGDEAGVFEVIEEVIPEYPKDEYWLQYIGRAQTAAGYGPALHLDLYRALRAAGVKLTAQQISFAADTAIDRGMPNEALTLLELPGAPTSEQDVKNLETARTQAPKDKAGLAAETASVIAKGDAAVMATMGEAHLTYGDYARAAEVLQTALDKGIADAGAADAARLHLGIAQLRLGNKDAARATWASVSVNTAAGALAQGWILISKIVA